MATTYGNYGSTDDFMGNEERRNSTVNKMKQSINNNAQRLGGTLKKSTSAGIKPIRETLGKSVDFSKGNKLKTLGRGANALGVGIEGYRAYDDINSGHLSGSEKVDRGLESTARFAGSLAGAKAGARLGAMVPIPHPLVKAGAAAAGGVVGGGLGFFSPELIQGAADKLGFETNELPSQKVARLRQENAPVAQPQQQLPADGGQPEVQLPAIKPRVNQAPSVINNQPWKTNQPQPKVESGSKTINASQQQVNEVMAMLRETLQAPAAAESLGDAVLQKSRNKNATNLLAATIQAANQNNQGELDLSNIRQGEQRIAEGKTGQALTDQKVKLGNFQVDNLTQLKEAQTKFDTLNDKNDADGSQRRQLLSMMGALRGDKQTAPYEFIKLSDGMSGDRLVTANKQTGKIIDDGAQQQVQYEDGQREKMADGKMYEYDKENDVWSVIS